VIADCFVSSNELHVAALPLARISKSTILLWPIAVTKLAFTRMTSRAICSRKVVGSTLTSPQLQSMTGVIAIGRGKAKTRRIGDVLHPERESKETLDRIKAESGSLKFSAQRSYSSRHERLGSVLRNTCVIFCGEQLCLARPCQSYTDKKRHPNSCVHDA
jgi:hypothetical protein